MSCLFVDKTKSKRLWDQ